MKKQLMFVFALIICYSAAKSQTPAITMTSSMSVGSLFSFIIEAADTNIQVDFGDGTLISKTISNAPFTDNPGTFYYLFYGKNIVSGTLKGSKTVKVYGTGITSLLIYYGSNLISTPTDSLTSLDISNCSTLKWLDCSYNQLTSLDLSNNTALRYLVCKFNQLSSLNINPHTGLEWLDCGANLLPTLDVNKNTALYYLACSSNSLTTLDVSKNIELSTLGCSDNQLTTLDVSKNTTLGSLYCGANQLTTLDVSKNTALANLDCSYNLLTSLDVSKSTTSLGTLFTSFNRLTNLDVSKNTGLWRLECAGNLLTTIDVNSNSLLKILNCNGNLLTSLDLSKDTLLTSLNCGGNQLTFLDVSHNVNITGINCSYNQLTSIDVSTQPVLMFLDCYNNQLTNLDVSHNSGLFQLNCYNNQLANLYLNTGLTFLYCYNNQLTILDVSKNTQLALVLCQNNKFTFATLPTIPSVNAPQSPIFIEKNLGTGNLVDLSSQLTISGNTTVYTWKTKSGATLVQGTDYSLTDGKTIFLKSQDDSVYCEMTNATFPLFAGDDVLKTTFTKVSINTGIDNVLAPGFQIYARNKTVYIIAPYKGQASVYDINGRLTISKEISVGDNTITMQNGGVYLIKLTGRNTPVIKKIFAEY